MFRGMGNILKSSIFPLSRDRVQKHSERVGLVRLRGWAGELVALLLLTVCAGLCVECRSQSNGRGGVNQ